MMTRKRTCSIDKESRQVYRPSKPSIPSPSSAWQLLEERAREAPIYLLDPVFPLFYGELAQLSGPAGSGKTQVALATCKNILLRNGQAVYLSTTGTGPSQDKLCRRFQRMLPMTHRHLMRKLWVLNLRNSEDLLWVMDHRLPQLLEAQPAISLIVLDSIAALYRIQDTTSLSKSAQTSRVWQKRSAEFFELARRLKKLSIDYRVAVLVVNEVTQSIGMSDNTPSSSTHKPALGLSWSQCATASFQVLRTTTGARSLSCRQSSAIPSSRSVDFQISTEGLNVLEEQRAKECPRKKSR